jgi:hypothetical protein
MRPRQAPAEAAERLIAITFHPSTLSKLLPPIAASDPPDRDGSSLGVAP